MRRLQTAAEPNVMQPVEIMNIEEILKASIRFREAIEKCQNSLGLGFGKFPKGSCGDATPLLGTYLIELNLGTFMYALGNLGSHKKGNWCSHAWLQSGSIVVDITADQFPEVSEKVIVSSNSKWHKSLKGKHQHIADYRIYDVRTKSAFHGQYTKILENINC